MGRGRSILLALLVAANVVVAVFLVADPQMTRYMPGCSDAGTWVDWIGYDESRFHTACGVETSSLVERGGVLRGALLGNSVILAATLVARRRAGVGVGASTARQSS